MFDSIAKSVQSVAADAYSSIKSTIDRSGPKTKVGTTSPHDIFMGDGSSTRLKRPASLMSGERGPYTQSVTRFLDDFEAEQECVVPEDHSVLSRCSRVDTEQTTKRQIASSQPMSATEPLSPRRSDRLDERRALGIPEKSPSHAVKILVPMPRQPFVTKGRLQPYNTLSQPKSARAKLLHERVPRSNHTKPEIEPRTTYQKSREPEVLENNHDRPNKRQRNGRSPVEGSTRFSAISIDDNQDVIEYGRDTIPSEVAAGFNVTSPGADDRQDMTMNPPQRTLSVQESTQDSHRKHARTPSSTSRYKFKPHRFASPDELLDDEFTRNARMQRLQGPLKEDIDGESQEAASQSRVLSDATLSLQQTTFGRPRRNSTNAQKESVSMSKLERRLHVGEESPDALQGDATIVTPSHIHGAQFQAGQRVQSKYFTTPVRKGVRDRNLNTPLPGSNSAEYCFPVIDYVYGTTPVGTEAEMALFVNSESNTLALGFSHPQLGKESLFTMPIRKIVRAFREPEDGGGRTMFVTNDENDLLRRIYFQFATEEISREFWHILGMLDSSIKAAERSQRWMIDAFSKAVQTAEEISKREAYRSKRSQSVVAVAPEPNNSSPAGQMEANKARTTSKLSHPNGRTVVADTGRSSTDQALKIARSPPLAKDSNKIPNSELVQLEESRGTTARPTRSRTRNRVNTYSADDVPLAKKESEFEKLKRWKKPLVYPATGKKRETVQFDDLQRLDDDEFLNDNLVCLFLRYIEEHADKEKVKKIHFFNSFLVETLTKDAKSRRHINFDTVKKWTAKVDLFNRDFVVVPVNEHMHWFVMIICNLPYFKQQYARNSGAEDEDEDDSIMQSALTANDNAPEIILRSDLEGVAEASTRDSFAEMTLDDQITLDRSPTIAKSTSSHRGRRKQHQPMKYDVEKPVIITLDSLDQSRSTTASLLRQYITAEAKDKKDWDINAHEIRGMTAKGIPHQDNFSDCGLYLCMYLEQFVLDPYRFVYRILQRTDGAGWPRKIESSELRRRLRKMLLSLHDQQSGIRVENEIPSLGSILVDMNLPEQAEQEQVSYEALQGVSTMGKHHDIQSPLPQEDETGHLSDNLTQPGQPMINSVEEWKKAVNEPIEIDDDLPTQPSVGGLTKGVEGPANIQRINRNQRQRSGSASTEYLLSGEGYDADDDNRRPSTRPLPLGDNFTTEPSKKVLGKFRKFGRIMQRSAANDEDTKFDGFSDSIPSSPPGRFMYRNTGHALRDKQSDTRKVLGEITGKHGHEELMGDGMNDDSEMLIRR